VGVGSSAWSVETQNTGLHNAVPTALKEPPMKKTPLLGSAAAIALAAGLTIGLAAPSAHAQSATTVTTTIPLPTSSVNVIDQLKNTKALTTLAAAVDAAGLTETLRTGGPFTIFAPDNVAFDLVGKENIAELLKPQNKARLAAVLGIHVVPGRLSAGDLQRVPGGKVKSIAGQDLELGRRDGRVTVNGSGVRQADVVASNAVIHIIDTVLTPAASTAPISPIDQAKSSGLTTFVAAVEAAGLTSTLQGAGPYTMFVPDNVAFELLGQGAAANLLKPENKAALVARLQVHVVSGRFTAADIAKLKVDVKNLAGTNMVFGNNRGRVTVGKAGVIKADIITNNGVIHIIDTVL
jgi:transforming growth factor-beta-induced protein